MRLRAAGLSALCAWPAEVLLPRVPEAIAQPLKGKLLWDHLDEVLGLPPETPGRVLWRLAPEVRTSLLDAAHGLLAEHLAAASDGARDEAERLVRPAPDEPRLARAHAGLLSLWEARPEAGWSRGEAHLPEHHLRPAEDPAGFRYRERTPDGGWVAVVLALPEGEDDGRCRCTCELSPCLHIHTALGLALDLVTRETARPPEVDAALDRATASRTTRLFDGLRALGESAEDEEVRAGFRLREELDGDLTLIPIFQSRTRSGGMGRGRKARAEDLTRLIGASRLPGERRALTWLKDHGVEGLGGAVLVLPALAGHPRLRRDDTGETLTQVETPVTLHIVLGDGDGERDVRLEPHLGEMAWDPDALLALHRVQGRVGRIARLDGETLQLVPLGPGLESFLELLSRHGRTHPASAIPDLLAGLPDLERILPVKLPEALAGAAVPARSRLCVRLDRVGGGGLALRLSVSPVSGGATHRPGHGPRIVYGTRDGERVHAIRDLGAEAEEARALQAELGLTDGMATGPTAWTIPTGPLAAAAIDTLSALAEARRIDLEGAADAFRLVPAEAAGLSLKLTRRRDWLGLSGHLTVGEYRVDLMDLLTAVRDESRYVRVAPDAFAIITDSLRARLSAVAAGELHGDEVWLSAGAAFELEGLAEDGAELDTPETWTDLVARRRRSRDLTPPVPAGLNATLRPYQQAGFEWMARLSTWAEGGVLADDMGLGKTVQTITLLLHRAPAGPALIVAPTSCVGNWVRELNRFAPSLTVYRHDTPEGVRAASCLSEGEVLVTTYGRIVREVEQLAELNLGTFVLDEAQAVKNPSTRRTKACRALNADFKLALSGTPMENHLGELWSLFRVVLPGYLGSRERFSRTFLRPIEKDGDEDRQALLARLVRPVLLRRTKEEVTPDLPPRIDIEERVRLSLPERTLYEKVRRGAIERMLLPREGVSDEARRFEMLTALTRLRRLACHPKLYDPASPMASSKQARIIELALELVAEGHRALLFSQFTSHLQLTRASLESRGIRCQYLDGNLSSKQRDKVVEDFRRGEGEVFLISLTAGGTGLNLVEADYVLHLDPWWNPALEDQATDRSHRIGQTRPVTVIRMVAEDTLESRILELHAEKRALADALLEGADGTHPLSVGEMMDVLTEAGLDRALDDDDDDEVEGVDEMMVSA